MTSEQLFFLLFFFFLKKLPTIGNKTAFYLSLRKSCDCHLSVSSATARLHAQGRSDAFKQLQQLAAPSASH